MKSTQNIAFKNVPNFDSNPSTKPLVSDPGPNSQVFCSFLAFSFDSSTEIIPLFWKHPLLRNSYRDIFRTLPKWLFPLLQ